jgi:site-specific DNA-methyltransferase (adenine-specific)
MKPDYQIKNVKLYNCDNMIFMKEIPDNFYDLAIVDPPYGLGKRLSQGAGKLKNSALQNMNSEWDIKPDKSYFDELFRISKNQIIWGGNYFNLPPTRGIICWDKKQYMPTFSRWEYAWSSFDCPAKMFDKYVQEKRIHPTQKPIQLYKWILSKYAKDGWKLIDTHGGSASIGCACIDEGFDIDILEISKEMSNKAVMRLKNNVQDYFDFA